MKINLRRLSSLIISFVLAVLAVFSMAVPKASAAVTHQGLAAPMYQYPTVGTYWSDITGIGGSKIPFVLVDPASGPGTTVDPNYTNAIAGNTAQGIRSIGYVDTNYTARSYQSVADDIAGWHSLYPGVTGIFLDRIQTGTAADLCYNASLYAHLKNQYPNDLVILNPGTHIGPEYEPYGDIFLNAENTFAAYQSGWSIQYPGWEDNPLYSNRFWQILHTTSSGNYATALSLMRANNAGWVFITDDTMPNPYDTTPSYWNTEVSDVSSLPLPAIPNRGLTALPAGCQQLSSSSTTSNITSAKSNVLNANITVANTDTTFNVEPTTKMTFSLPAGVTFSGSGTGWSCTTGGVCNYANTINASQNAAVLGASFTAGCDYTTGDVRATLSNFAGNTSSSTFTPTRPADCAAVTLANTGLPTMTITMLALGGAAVALKVYFSRTRIHYQYVTVRRRRK